MTLMSYRPGDWCISHQYDDPDNPILIISHSFGGGRYLSVSSAESNRPSYAAAAGRAIAAGITIFASSGNEGYCDALAAPAAFSDVISVGAVYDAGLGTIGFCVEPESCVAEAESQCDPEWACWDSPSAADGVTCYSNTASFLEVLAPSHDAYTLDIVGSGGYGTGDYTTDFGGTSAACPYAAGAAVALQSAAKTLTGNYLTPAEVRNILTSTGDNITDSKASITKPRINLQNAIDSIVVTENPPQAFDVSETTDVDTPVLITLDATDEGLPNPPGSLSYIITSLPSHGQLNAPSAADINSVPYTLAGFGNQVNYTPDISYVGSDSFQFKANDGGTPPDGGDSNTATVSINVTAAPEFIYSARYGH